LKEGIAADQFHIGTNHYFIHVTEPYSHPENALKSANLLRTLVPGSEHLVHMPTHIYFLTGRYHEGTRSNFQAIEAYQQYNKTCHAQGFEPEINYLYFHNYDFLRTTAAMEGRKKVALRAAKQIMDPPFAAWLKHESTLQWFIPIPFYAEARFGMWNDILKESMPNEKYSYAVGMWHYARGMALAHTDDFNAAQSEAKKLRQIIQKGKTESTLGEAGDNLLGIADAILTATLADIQGNEKTTLANLQKAVKIQHDMGYHEPPDWYFPTKQALADAYLKWGHPQKAKEVYEQDLREYPQNGWSLYGLVKSLRALGENEKATRVEEDFKKAWKYADIPAPVSLFPPKNNSG
jgi:tetratricopeptide (TPR) repeat protein